MTNENEVAHKYNEIVLRLIEKKIQVTTMESCTSGAIASLITDTEGASAIFKGGFVTYSNEAKIMCGVDAGIIEKFGVYSAKTACAMARECRLKINAGIGIGVTGSFGNADPANADSVPGEVHIALSMSENVAGRCPADVEFAVEGGGEAAFGCDGEATIGYADISYDGTMNRRITLDGGISRHASKLIVADAVADMLLDVIPYL